MNEFLILLLQFVAAPDKYFTTNACNGTAAAGTYTSSAKTAGVMCCGIAGGVCSGSCDVSQTWSAAVLTCAFKGMRLCSKGEVVGLLCCGQGDTTCDAKTFWTLSVEGGK